MITPDQALAALQQALGGHLISKQEKIKLAQAAGRILATPLKAKVDHPPCAMSAMDGYAVRFTDIRHVPVWLDIVGENAAGTQDAGRIGQGQSMRIFTGAPLPQGADTVLIEEETERREDRVHILDGAKKGSFVRPRGHDFHTGNSCLVAGTIIGSRHIALAAAMNLPTISVLRRARIAVLALGDELLPVGSEDKSSSGIIASSLPALKSMPAGSEGKVSSRIIASSLPALKVMIQSSAVEVLDLGIVGDDDTAIRHALKQARAVDLIVTTGGASIGRHDRMRRLLCEGDKDTRLIFDKVSMQPGKPTIFALRQGIPILALPGNPVSTMVCGWFFLRAALTTMLSLRQRYVLEPTARLAQALPVGGKRTQFLRAAVVGRDESGFLVEAFANQDSGGLAVLADSDVLIRREARAPAARKGEKVTVATFSPLLGDV